MEDEVDEPSPLELARRAAATLETGAATVEILLLILSELDLQTCVLMDIAEALSPRTGGGGRVQ